MKKIPPNTLDCHNGYNMSENKIKGQGKKVKTLNKKRKIIFLAIGISFIVCCVTVGLVLGFLAQIDYVLVDNPKYEVNTENTITTLFKEIRAGTLSDESAKIDTSSIGDKNQTVTITSKLGTQKVIDIPYFVVDTTPPTISGDDVLTFRIDEEKDILGHYQADDNSLQNVELSIDGEYDLEKTGDYDIHIIARDESGNESIKEIKLSIVPSPQATHTSSATKNPYYIEVHCSKNL